ncbi:nucleotidyltransferase family protein [Candidatus Poribacteria bacterium]|nr:nucleotidyltransferase family protein [Candidatus Poribacteria bacterium]
MAAVDLFAMTLRAAVRRTALGDRSELVPLTRRLESEMEAFWQAFWRRNRSPLLVASALLSAEQDGDLPLSLELRDRLEAVLAAGGRRYAILKRELDSIQDAAEVPIVPLKGMWLTERVYPTHMSNATRLFGDIDIGVDPAHFGTLRESLVRLGYQVSPNSKPFEYAVHRRSAEPTWTGLPMLESDDPVPPELLEWGNRTLFVEVHTGSVDKMRFVKTPFVIRHEDDAASHFVHICLHVACHMFRHTVGFVDAALLLHSALLDWSEVRAKASDPRAMRAVSLVLGMVAKAFGEDIVPMHCAAERVSTAFRLGSRLAGADVAVRPMEVLWRGSRAASSMAVTTTSRRFVAGHTARAVLNAWSPPATRPRRAWRWLRKRWRLRSAA